MNYLWSLLDHSAYDANDGLTLSSTNYQQAIEILHKRFGNKLVIILKHMNMLMNIDPISSDCHLKDVHRLYDHTESHVWSLRSIGIEAASYGALLSPVLLAKLPPDLRLIVSSKVSSSNLDMDALLSTFEEELTARERVCPQLTWRTTSCTSVNIHADRKQILKTSARCLKCFHRSPVLQNCKPPSRGQECNWKHHTSNCDAGQQKASTLHRLTKPALNPEAEPFMTVLTTTALCADNVQTLFLQTTCAVIHHPSKPMFQWRYVSFWMEEAKGHTERARETGSSSNPPVCSCFPLQPLSPAQESKGYVLLSMWGCASGVIHPCHFLSM